MNQDEQRERKDAVVEHKCFGCSREDVVEDAAFRNGLDPQRTRDHFNTNYWR
jgi:hypothetical protein